MFLLIAWTFSIERMLQHKYTSSIQMQQHNFLKIPYKSLYIITTLMIKIVFFEKLSRNYEIIEDLWNYEIKRKHRKTAWILC